MSFNKTANIGSLGAFLLMITNTLSIVFEIDKYTSTGIFIRFTYFIGSALLLISLCGCFKYTQNSNLGCKINLIGVFSVITLLAVDILNLLGFAFPILLTLYTYTTLSNIALVLSYALISLFLLSIYYNHTSKGLNSIMYKVTMVTISINTAILIPFSLLSMILGDLSVFSPTLTSFTPSFMSTITFFVLTVLICINYKSFLTELKFISETTKDTKIYEAILES